MNNNEMPMDGTEFNAVVVSYIPYRYKLYKPSSNEAKSGIKGRWQRMNDYGGWDNTDTPPTRASTPAPVERIDHLKTALMNAVTPFYEEDKAEWVLYCGGKESAVAILQAARAYLKLQGGD